MEIKCENCAYYLNCSLDKDKPCADFIFKRRETDKPVTVKTNRIKKG